MRIRSYGVFHRIYESMVLGMHPVFAYLRRSRVAPFMDGPMAGVETHRYESAVPQPIRLF